LSSDYTLIEEISLFGRGGQGVVTAGELLVSAAVKDGLYGQSIPFYGGERRGAPVRSDVRISDEPLYLHRRTYNSDVVAVFDSTLLDILKVTEGLKEDGSMLINSKRLLKVWKNTYVVDASTMLARGCCLTRLMKSPLRIFITAVCASSSKLWAVASLSTLSSLA